MLIKDSMNKRIEHFLFLLDHAKDQERVSTVTNGLSNILLETSEEVLGSGHYNRLGWIMGICYMSNVPPDTSAEIATYCSKALQKVRLMDKGWPEPAIDKIFKQLGKSNDPS